MPGFIRPEELNQIIIAAEDAKLDEDRKDREKKEKQKRDLKEAFMSKQLHPDVMDRVNSAVRLAAEQGRTEVDVITFPCTFCNDRGRRINNRDADWPDSLEGFAKTAYDYYNKELRPLGYKLHAEIVSFPDGIPGDAKMTLTW